MSKKNKQGRSASSLSKFFALEQFIVALPSWRSLSLPARCVYLELGLLYNGSNNGRIALSARQVAQRLPLSRATATRAFQELETKGFIATQRTSGFNLKSGVRHATEWRLTRYRCDVSGCLPTKEFTKWRPGMVKNVASHGGHSGFTTEPPSPKSAQNGPEVVLSRSRRGNFGAADGFTTEPHINIYHRGVALNSMQSAGPANQKAGAKRPIENGTPQDAFVPFGQAAIKSILAIKSEQPPRKNMADAA